MLKNQDVYVKNIVIYLSLLKYLRVDRDRRLWYTDLQTYIQKGFLLFKDKTVLFMDIIKALSDELGIKEKQIEKTIALIDEGNTIPFIAALQKGSHRLAG